MNTVTGLVAGPERVGTSRMGNPSYSVHIVTVDGEVRTYRTQSNAGIAYAINNQEYRKTVHTFHLTRAGRIRWAEPTV